MTEVPPFKIFKIQLSDSMAMNMKVYDSKAFFEVIDAFIVLSRHQYYKSAFVEWDWRGKYGFDEVDVGAGRILGLVSHQEKNGEVFEQDISITRIK